MKLYSLLNENHVLLDVEVATFVQAVDRLLTAFADVLDPGQVDLVRARLMEREEQFPTFMAEGVCIPHARMGELKNFLLGVLVPRQPLPHPAEGQPPVTLIFMVLAPQDRNTMMLQTLAAIARLLKSRETRQALQGVKSESRFLRLIEDTGIDVKKTLVAADIMAPVGAAVTLDTSIAHAVDVLVNVEDEGVPVVDAQGRLAGELTSKELLTLGMPRYMDLLVNSSMLDNFEPFEHYFRQENTMRVREICRRDLITVEPSMPIVQVTHLMMTRSRRRIYVVDGDELKGIIYRKDIVARVLHY